MRIPLVLAFACLCVGSASLAGPNAGGVLVAHDPSFIYTDLMSDYCGAGTAPTSCSDLDTELDGSSPSQYARIWKVFSLFPPASAPRLKALTFGIHYPTGRSGIAIQLWGPCIGDLNAAQPEYTMGWPGSDTGVALVFQDVQTTSVVECFWFSGYTLSASAHNLFTLRDHPDPMLGGAFWDDSVPALRDPISAYGSLGFDTPGQGACPTQPGACCFADGQCLLMIQSDCIAQQGFFYGFGIACDPNPCTPSAVPQAGREEIQSWGRIKTSYR